MRTEFRISGFGGQGVALAGLILGKAFSIYQEYEAVMTQAYGPEARGGASCANIVVADRLIDYPFVQNADVLVALSQEAYARFRPEAKQEAAIFIDEDLVNPSSEDDLFKIPATRLAESLGRRIVTNMVMLGFLTAHNELIERDAMEQAIKSSVRANTIALNIEAFAKGYDYIPKEAKALE